MSVDSLTSGPRPRGIRAGWGWMLLSTVARFYLVFMGALAAAALAPMLFGLTGSVVQSGSMEPHISTGDVVLSQAVPAKAPAPMGRVITFRAPVGASKTSLELHRLVAKNKNGTLVTAGDANPDPDSTPLARRNIISQACLLIPWIGLPSIWVQSGALLPLILWVLLTMVALMIEAVDLTTAKPPAPTPPSDPEGPSGSGPEPEPDKAVRAARPQRELISSLLHRFSVLKRIRVDIGSIGVVLVAVLTAVALAMSPLGVAAAAFTARAISTGNAWNTAGPATKLAFTTNPSGSSGGTAFATQPVVAVLAADGNTVGVSNASVTLSITTPAGATLSCTQNPKVATSGVATFAGCRIDKAGTYTLRATSGTLTSDVSTSFTIGVGPASKLAFTTDPPDSVSGIAFGTQPVVAAQDAGGNTVTSSTASVTLSITTHAGAVLTCTANPARAVSGVASFAGCTINHPGTYTLTAASSGLTSAVSASFTITAGPASRLTFSTNPSSSTGGTPFASQPVVAVQDAGGNTVATSTAPVTLSITTAAGATLACSANPVSAIAGVASFAGCAISLKTGTYTLTAASSGLANAVSASFTITAGSATKLAFTTNPSSSTGGTLFASQPVVAVQDAGGNTVATSTAPVTLSITTAAGATLACTANPVNAVAGVATFAGCAISLKTGTYTLTAASSGLANAVSASFTITAGSATKLAFTTNPSSSTGGTPFATQPVVTITDAGGNTVTTSTAPVTLTITTPAGATLTCTANPVNAVAGVASFAGCAISLKTGTYTLTAASSGLANAVSASFTITAGSATCSDAVLASSPYLYYKFDETTAATAVDSSGNGRNGTYLGTGTTTGSPGACVHDTSTAITLNGSTGYISTPTLISTAPNTFTIETWFKTTTTNGGKLIGYGSAKTGLSSQYDRHLYMTSTGKIIFGVYPNAVRIITSPASYNDGSWHLAAATLSTEGMKLYLDGQVVATDPATTTAQAFSGYWRIGYDNLNGWTNKPNSNFLAATIDDAAIYTTALNAVTIAAHYTASR